MFYKVSEISTILDLSKVSVYSKVNSLNDELKGCIKHKKGVMYIDDEGLLILKRYCGLLEDENTLNNTNTGVPENTDYSNASGEFKDIKNDVKTLKRSDDSYRDEYINSLNEQINHLKEQIKIKDDQLQNKDELLKNFQVLLKQEQDKVLMLESAATKEERKGFWARLFGKS